MKHYIDELFNDTEAMLAMSSDDFDISKVRMEAVSIDADDMKVEGPLPDTLPILAIRDAVLFPFATMPVQVTREASKALLSDTRRKHMKIGVVTQRRVTEFPGRDDLYDVGCMAKVLSVTDLGPDEKLVIISGGPRFSLGELVQSEPYLVAHVHSIPPDMLLEENGDNIRSELASIKKKIADICRHKDPRQHVAIKAMMRAVKDENHLINNLAAQAPIDVDLRQNLLYDNSIKERAQHLLEALTFTYEALQLEKKVTDKVHKMMDKQQREYFLNQQMHVIQEELGGSPFDKEMDEMETRAAKMKWSDEIRQRFMREMDKLRRIPPQQPDFFVQQNYLQFMLDLPWNVYSDDNLDMKHARRVLDKDHYGLEKIKDRILEYIAAMRINRNLKAPILCLVGPPGTGKTSLGASIAKALDRKYVRMALGGVHDESEIRGHRRTYVGAMAGRVLQSIKRAGVSNPVVVLDEIDKVQSNSFNGDPTSALLEVLDPEQNVAFRDNYLDENFDLSKVLFIATANSLATIQPALLDRMEVIEISGYLQEEKMEIAKRHLLPRLIKEYGLQSNDAMFQPATLEMVINEYTHESGVRQLEQQLATCVRKRCMKLAEEGFDAENVQEPRPRTYVKTSDLKEMLGLPIHHADRYNDKDQVGVVTGLAWTQNGGVVLLVEAAMTQGEGKLSMTGNLGDVMKESATLAFEYIKTHAVELGVDAEVLKQNNIHVHCPEGATPKDGPSAGITLVTAMVSVLTNRKVRSCVAMTGEITLRGAVTPIGGVKEKILAARRAGRTDLVLCRDNQRDVEDIPAHYLKGLTFHYVSNIGEVLPIALCSETDKK